MIHYLLIFSTSKYPTFKFRFTCQLTFMVKVNKTMLSIIFLLPLFLAFFNNRMFKDDPGRLKLWCGDLEYQGQTQLQAETNIFTTLPL